MTLDEILNVDILDALGLSHASEGEKEKALDDAATFVLMHVIKRIRLELPMSKRDEFERILQPETSNEERIAFLNAHVPDFEDMVLEEMLRFKAAMGMKEEKDEL